MTSIISIKISIRDFHGKFPFVKFEDFAEIKKGLYF